MMDLFGRIHIKVYIYQNSIINKMTDLMSWDDFLTDIKHLLVISDRLHDGWSIIRANETEGHSYLSKKIKQNIPINNPSDHSDTSDLSQYQPNYSNILIQFEYHLLYHISYRVPFLCFNAYKSDGSLVKLTEAWEFFDKNYLKSEESLKLTSILTEMDHPILFKPFLTLHPCRTAELLSSLPDSKNKVLSFLSAIGPAVHLKMDLEYEKERLSLSQ